MLLCKACNFLIDDGDRKLFSFPESYEDEPWHFCDHFDIKEEFDEDVEKGLINICRFHKRFAILACPGFKPLDYYRWINSNAYRGKRNEKLKAVGYKCELCGSAKNLQVHHITYENLGYEPLDDLLVVCRKCHEELHKEDLKQKEDSDCTTLE